MTIPSLDLVKSGKSIRVIDTETRKPLRVTSKELYLPFGVSSWENQYSKFQDYSLQTYVNIDPEFEKYCEELDEKVKSLCLSSPLFENGEYKSLLKQNKDFPRLFKINLPRDRFGNFDFVVFDKDLNKIMVTEDNVEYIFCKKRTFTCIFESCKVWQYNGSIGTIWNLVQVKYKDLEVVEDASTNVPTCKGEEDAYNTCML